MAVYRAKHIQPSTIGLIPKGGYVKKINHSVDSIRWLDFVAVNENIAIQHGMNGCGEIKLNGIYVDGFCQETNTIYFYHGCFFHGCEKCYDGDRKNPLYDRPMNYLFKQTKQKTAFLRQQGYQVQELWEHDFKHMKKSNKDLQQFLIEHSVVDRLDPREAFFGGRTNAITLYYEGTAKYVDFTSLYPWVNKYCR